MRYFDFPTFLALWLEASALLLACHASPGFTFVKHTGSSTPASQGNHDSGHTTGGSQPNSGLNLERICPTSFDPKDTKLEKTMARKIAHSRQANGYPPITIPIHFHIVAANKTVEGGWVPHRNLRHQVQVLNQDFASTNISWRISKVDRIINETWFYGVGYDDPLAHDMHNALRVGDAKVMNVYTTSFSTVFTTSGYAAFPWNYANFPKSDGVTMRHTVLAGGSDPLFNDGRYLTHEAGHWVGLYHTFEGSSCEGAGDYVADTPMQSSPSNPGDSTCTQTDTCVGVSGVDPITNFMDYSHPGCQTSFTSGQVDRLRWAIKTHRGFD